MRRIGMLFACLAGVVALSGCASPEEASPTPYAEEMGDFYLRSGRYAEAAEEYGSVIERRPGRFESRVGMGEAMLGLGRPVEAREHFEVAYSVRPNDDGVAELLAQSMLDQGDVTGMNRFLDQRAQDRQRVGDWMRFGRFNLAAGDYDEAERGFRTAARLDAGQSLDCQMALADLYAVAGDREKEIERLRMALFLAPRNAEIRDRLERLGETPGPTLALEPVEAVESRTMGLVRP